MKWAEDASMVTYTTPTRYKISNHTPLIMSSIGVWQLEPKVFILHTRMTRREGPGYTQNNTILFLKDIYSQ